MSQRVGLRYIAVAGRKKKVMYPSAFNYDNLQGKVWMPEPWSYDKRKDGSVQIEVRDPYGTSPAGDMNGGSYDNRE